jgi:tryptophan-rich sensory protein
MNKELNQFKKVKEKIDNLNAEKNKESEEIVKGEKLLFIKERIRNLLLSSMPVIVYIVLVFLLIPSKELFSALPSGEIDPSLYPVEYILLIKYKAIFLLTTISAYLSYRINKKNKELQEKEICISSIFIYVMTTIIFFLDSNHYNVSVFYFSTLFIPLFFNSLELLKYYNEIKEAVITKKGGCLSLLENKTKKIEEISESLKQELTNYDSLKNEIVRNPEIMESVLIEAKKPERPIHIDLLIVEFYEHRKDLEKEKKEEDKLKDAYRSVFNIDLEKTRMLND